MTRREYCQKQKNLITTFDYWRRAQKSKPRLIEVEIETEPSAGFALMLANGGRIEIHGASTEADLNRLIRVAEP